MAKSYKLYDRNSLSNILSQIGIHKPKLYNSYGYYQVGTLGYIYAKGETDQALYMSRNALYDGANFVAADASEVASALVLENDGTLKFLYGAAAANPTLSQKLKVDTSGNIIMNDGSYIGQAAGPYMTFDDTNNYLEIMGCNVGIGTTNPTGGHLQVEGSSTGYQGYFYNTNTTDGDGVRIRTDYQNNASILLNVENAGADLLQVQGGASGIGRVLIPSGNVGIGTMSPKEKLDVRGAAVFSGTAVNAFNNQPNRSLVIDNAYPDSRLTAASDDNGNQNINLRALLGGVPNNGQVFLQYTGNVGIGTAAPGQILDVNQGSGNMIADGYDQHSLLKNKENIVIPQYSFLERLEKIQLYEYKRVPYVSAEELKVLAIERFGEDVWDSEVGENYRDEALWDLPDNELKRFIDEKAEELRMQKRAESKWQKKHYGLIADDKSLINYLPEVIGYNSKGEISGISLGDYVGFLHGCIFELWSEVKKLKQID